MKIKHIKYYKTCAAIMFILFAVVILGAAIPGKGYIVEGIWDIIKSIPGFIVGSWWVTTWNSKETNILNILIASGWVCFDFIVGVLAIIQTYHAFFTPYHDPDYLMVIAYDYTLLICYVCQICSLLKGKICETV